MFSPNNKEELQLAIHLWCEYEQEALARYGPINKWDVSNVKNMNYMFNNVSFFNQNISSWNIKQVVYCHNMFNHCSIKEEYKPKLE